MKLIERHVRDHDYRWRDTAQSSYWRCSRCKQTSETYGGIEGDCRPELWILDTPLPIWFVVALWIVGMMVIGICNGWR